MSLTLRQQISVNWSADQTAAARRRNSACILSAIVLTTGLHGTRIEIRAAVRSAQLAAFVAMDFVLTEFGLTSTSLEDLGR
jgi:hypothetical protein